MQKTDLNVIEARLRETLQPVPLRPEFVKDLKARLFNTPEISLETPKAGLLGSIVLASAGLLSGVVLVVVGIKTMVSLTKKLNVISQVQKHVETKKTNPLPTAL